jgi:methionyl-tRNA formyltransferase
VAPRVVQNEAHATYEPPASDSNSIIDWSQPARQVYNLIRGSNPTPGAHARLRGELVRVFDAQITPGDGGGEAGTVTETGDSINIALNGGTLHALRLQAAGGKKIGAAEFAQTHNVAIDDRFENGEVAAT